MHRRNGLKCSILINTSQGKHVVWKSVSRKNDKHYAVCTTNSPICREHEPAIWRNVWSSYLVIAVVTFIVLEFIKSQNEGLHHQGMHYWSKTKQKANYQYASNGNKKIKVSSVAILYRDTAGGYRWLTGSERRPHSCLHIQLGVGYGPASLHHRKRSRGSRPPTASTNFLRIVKGLLNIIIF